MGVKGKQGTEKRTGLVFLQGIGMVRFQTSRISEPGGLHRRAAEVKSQEHTIVIQLGRSKTEAWRVSGRAFR